MLDPETFLTELYVLVGDCCRRIPVQSHPGLRAALAPSEAITLTFFAQWQQFPSQSAFYRYPQRHRRPCFPGLASRPQFTRRLLRLHDQIAAGALVGAGVATRNKQRRGAGQLPGEAEIGKCTRLGFSEGARLLLCCTPDGAVTWFGVGPASTNDRVLAETLLAVRRAPAARLPTTGRATGRCNLADTGFGAAAWERNRAADLGAAVICPSQFGSKRAWPQPWRRWFAGLRQVVELVTHRVRAPCGLDRLRPHSLPGLLARLTATIGLFNACPGSTAPPPPPARLRRPRLLVIRPIPRQALKPRADPHNLVEAGYCLVPRRLAYSVTTPFAVTTSFARRRPQTRRLRPRWRLIWAA